MKWVETMDIVVLILTAFFTVLVVIVAIVIINLRKRRCELKKQEEKARKTQQELVKKTAEDLQKQSEVEEEVDDKVRKETELAAKKVEGEERIKAKDKAAEEKLREESEGRLKVEDKARLEKEVDRQQLPLDKRGGRPRGSTTQPGVEPSTEQKTRSLRPEIICWNERWRWIVGIEVPEEFESLSITQNSEVLEQDNSEEVRYPLHYIEGTVKVAWTEGEKDIPIMKEGRNYLIFKMRRNWKGLGRLVNRPTSGYYLAIVPEEWKRDEEMSGGAPVASENVQLDGYKAHFFGLRQNGDTPIAFIDANGERIQVEFGSSRFQLVGNEIFDSSDDMGPLFGEESPRIKTIDEQEWGNVGMIVVGEEGTGINRWRMQFVLQECVKEQRMPDELTNRKSGWYYLRIYDKSDDLLESMDFRFSTGLKDIRIMNVECLSKEGGYNDVTVQFIHQANCKVEPVDGEMYHALKIHRENDMIIVTVPPNHDYDKTHWFVRDGDAETKVTVLVERIWWCVGRIGIVPTNWTDKPVSLSRKDFTANTDKAIWMKFPRSRWISKIDVGFNRTQSRSYNVEVEKKEVAIPLRDFCDAKEIENKQEEFAMKIWVSPEGTKTYEAIILKISAELLPPVKPEPPPKPLPMIQPIVKSGHGKRKGKGFSRNEIAEAGIPKEALKRLHITYDKRRKSSYLWNIERLKSITER